MHNNMAQNVKCEFCLEEYQKDTLEKHWEMCMARSMFRCTICDGDYVSKEGLWNHLDLHEITHESKELHYQVMKATYKLHKCTLCNDQRGYQENLYWKHVREAHNDLLCCSNCGEKFRSQILKSEHDLTHCKAREQTLTGGMDSDQNCSDIVLPVQDKNTALLVSYREVHDNAAGNLEPSQGDLSCMPLEDVKCSEKNKVYQQGTFVPEKLNEDNYFDFRLIEFSPANLNVGYDTEKQAKVIPIPSSKSRSETDADQIPLKMEIKVEETRLLQHDDFEVSTPIQSSITKSPNFYQDSIDIQPKHSVISSVEFSGQNKKESVVIPIPGSKSRSETDADQIPLKMEIKVEETRILRHDDFEVSTPNQTFITDCPHVNQDSKDIKPKHSVLSSVEFSGQNEKESEVNPIPSTNSRSKTDADQIDLKMEITVEETTLLHHDDFEISTLNRSTITDCSYVSQHSEDQRGNNSELPSVEFSGQNLVLTSERKSDKPERFACTSSDHDIVDSSLNESSNPTFKNLHKANVYKKRTHLVDKGLRKAQVHQKGCSQERGTMNSEKSLIDSNRRRKDAQLLVKNPSSATSDEICSHCGKKFASVKSLSHHIESFCKPTTLNICEKLYPGRESSQDHKDCLPVPSGKRSQVTRDPPVEKPSDQRPRSSRQVEKRSRSISQSRSSLPATRRTQRKAAPDTQPKADSSETPDCLPVSSGKRSQVTRDPPVEKPSDQRPRSSRQVEKRSRSISQSRSSQPATRRTQRKAAPHTQPKADSSETPDCLPDPSSNRYRATQEQPVNITSYQRPSTSRQGKKRSQSLRRSKSSPPSEDQTSTSSEASDFSIDESSWEASEESSLEASPSQKRMKGGSSKTYKPGKSKQKRMRKSMEISKPHIGDDLKQNQNSKAQKSYACSICGLVFDHRTKLQYHEIRAHAEPKYKCSQCPKVYYRNDLLLRHETTHIKTGRNFVCESCPKSFRDIYRLQNHVYSTHPASELSCGICDLKFSTRTKLWFHKKKAHAEPKYKCSQCQKGFFQKTNLIRHEKTHSEIIEKKVACKLCPRTFQDELALRQHGYRAHPPSEIPCGMCDLKFSTRDKLRAHKQRAHAGQKYKCLQCPKKFYTNFDLQRHEILTHSETQERNEVCKLCPSTFRDKYVLKKHVYMVHPPSEVPCGMCDLKFSTRRKLESHMLKTHDERNVVCKLCSKTFEDKSKLQSHGYYAHPSSESSCNMCDLKFSNRSKLLFHMRKAHAEPKHKCSQCPKMFHKNFDRKRHEAITHSKTRERNVVCELCPKKFPDKYALHKHIYIYHPPSELPCGMCDLKFSSRPKLRHHKYTTHDSRYKCPECDKLFSNNIPLRKHIAYAHSKATEKQHSSDGSKRRRLKTKGEKPTLEDSTCHRSKENRKVSSTELRRSSRMKTKQ